MCNFNALYTNIFSFGLSILNLNFPQHPILDIHIFQVHGSYFFVYFTSFVDVCLYIVIISTTPPLLKLYHKIILPPEKALHRIIID